MTGKFLEVVSICVVLGISARLYVKDSHGVHAWHDGSEQTQSSTSYTMAPLILSMALTSAYLFAGCLIDIALLFMAVGFDFLGALLFVSGLIVGVCYYVCALGGWITVLVLGLARYRGRYPYFRIWLDAGSAHNEPQHRIIVALIVFVAILLDLSPILVFRRFKIAAQRYEEAKSQPVRRAPLPATEMTERRAARQSALDDEERTMIGSEDGDDSSSIRSWRSYASTLVGVDDKNHIFSKERHKDTWYAGSLWSKRAVDDGDAEQAGITRR